MLSGQEDEQGRWAMCIRLGDQKGRGQDQHCSTSFVGQSDSCELEAAVLLCTMRQPPRKLFLSEEVLRLGLSSCEARRSLDVQVEVRSRLC
jgi:hypothetical protein